MNSQAALDYLQLNRQAAPSLPKGAKRVSPIGLNREPLDIPQGPDDPEWRKRIPPPADEQPLKLPGEPTPAAAPVQAPPTPNKAAGSRRLVVNYARADGQYMVAVEMAPSWDIVGKPQRVSDQTLKEIAPVLRNLDVDIKNYTEEEW